MLAWYRETAALVAFALWAIGCATPAERLPGSPSAPMCPAGQDCSYGRSPSSMGAGPSDGSGGSAGEPGTLDVTGELAVALTAELDQVTSYGGAARVNGPGPRGAIVEASAAPGTGGAFTLKGVLSGNQWLFAQDDTAGGAGVFSTYSLHALPPTTKLEVPMLDQTVLQTIALDDPSAPVLDPTRAQIILALTHDGKPASGVSVTGGGATALVVYDEGPGVYSSLGEATGKAGVIVLLNASAPSGGGSFTLQGGDAAGHLFQLTMPTAPGAATVAELEI